MIWFLQHLFFEYGRILFAEVFAASIAFLGWALVSKIKAAPIFIRWCAGGIVVQYWLTLAFHTLLVLHCFSFSGAVVVSLCSGLLGIWLIRPLPVLNFTRQPRLLWRWLRAAVQREKLAWIVLPAVVAQLAVCLIIPPLAWDYQTYHGVKAAWWVQQGGPIHFQAPGGWGYYEHFPAQGSIMYAWAMVLFHSDRLVAFTSALYWPFFCLAAYGTARELGLPSRFAWLMAWFASSVPAVLEAKSQGWIDLSMHSDILCAVVFALYGYRRNTAMLVPWQAMAIGMAAATKVTGDALAAIILGAPLLLLGRTSTPVLIRLIILAVVLCALPVLPWLIASYAATGYPLSPFPMTLAGVVLGKASPEMQLYLQQPLASGHLKSLADSVALLRVFCSSDPMRLDPLVIPFLLLAPLGLYRWLRRDWRAGLLLSLLTLAFVEFYFSSSFAVVRRNFAQTDGRFFFALVVWGIMLGYLGLPRRWRPWTNRYAAAVIVFELIYFAMMDWPPVGGYLIAGGFALVAAAWLLLLQIPFPAISRGAFVGVVLVPATLLASFAAYDALRIVSFSTMKTRDDFHGAIGVVDQPDQSYRIALTSGPCSSSDQDFYYPMLGTELQNRLFYIPISQSGAILSNSDASRLAQANYDAWLSRLLDEKVDYVVSFSPRSIEFDWMEAHPGTFEQLAGSDDPKLDHSPFNKGEASGWGLFRLASSTSPLIRNIPGSSNW